MKTHPWCIRCIPFFKRAFILAILLSVVVFPLTASAFDLLLGTGETGTFSQFSGKLLARIITRHADGINCKYVPAPDDVYNLTNLQGGSLDLILIDTLTLHDAIQKKGAFEFLDINYTNLRALFPVYELPTVIVVRQDAKIETLDDLKGKRVNAGAPRSPEHHMMDVILQAKNWTPRHFSLMAELGSSLSEDTMAFCHGTVQALLFMGVHPDSSLQQLFKLCKARLIDLDDSGIEKLVSGHAAFSKIIIPAETYPSQAHQIITFGTHMLLVGSEDLDVETTRRILGAIDANRNAIQSAHPALASFKALAPRGTGIGLPLHPGAKQYYEGQDSP